MKVLIFGANGQLGISLQAQFSEQKIDFYAPTSKQLDITQPDLIQKTLREFSPDIAVNLAAYTKVDLAESNIDLAYKINALGCKNIAISCSMLDIPIIHISTDYVFDGLLKRPYKPTDATNPINIYGKSKIEGEELIKEYSKKYIIIRTSAVYGEFGNNFLKTMLKLSQTSQELSVVSDQYTTPTYSGDLTIAILKLCLSYQSNRFENNIFHYGGPKIFSWFDFAKEIFSFMRVIQPNLNNPVLIPVKSQDFTTAAQRPIFSALDSSSFINQYDLPCVNVSNRISSTIRKLIGEGFVS
jgi:dTDP-4-dehydrorhamnose reductase